MREREFFVSLLYLIWEFNWFEDFRSFDVKQCKKPGLSSSGSGSNQQLDTTVICVLCDGCDWRVQILQSYTKAECSESLSICRAEHLEGSTSCQPTNSSIWSKMKNRLLNFCHGQILMNSLHFYDYMAAMLLCIILSGTVRMEKITGCDNVTISEQINKGP